MALMRDDPRWEIADLLQALKCQRHRMQRMTVFNSHSATFHASAANEILKLGGALLRLNGVEKTNRAYAVCGFASHNCPRLLSANHVTAFYYSVPFVLWNQVISNTELTRECRMRIIGFVPRLFVLLLKAVFRAK
jgi:hypothetical protein